MKVIAAPWDQLRMPVIQALRIRQAGNVATYLTSPLNAAKAWLNSATATATATTKEISNGSPMNFAITTRTTSPTSALIATTTVTATPELATATATPATATATATTKEIGNGNAWVRDAQSRLRALLTSIRLVRPLQLLKAAPTKDRWKEQQVYEINSDTGGRTGVVETSLDQNSLRSLIRTAVANLSSHSPHQRKHAVTLPNGTTRLVRCALDPKKVNEAASFVGIASARK